MDWKLQTEYRFLEEKPLRKSAFNVKTKTNPNFAVKFAESSNHSFLLDFDETIFQVSVLFNMW